MLTIRLSRIGKKNKPIYRLIISEKARDPYGKALEVLGLYNPHDKNLQIKKERVEYWLSKGSGMSATVNNLLIEQGIIKGEKVKASKVKAKPEEEAKKESASADSSSSSKATEKKEVTEEKKVETVKEDAEKQES